MRLLTVLIALIFNSNQLLADLGSSVVYEILIETLDGRVIKGKVEVSGYEDYTSIDNNNKNEYCNDEKIRIVIDKIQERSKNEILTVYKEIYYPKYGFLANENGKLCQEYYGLLGVVKKSDIVEIEFKKIKGVKFVSAEKNKRSWLISELQFVTNQQLEWLQNKMFNDFWITYYPTETSMDGLILLNYDENYDKKRFEKLIRNLKEKLKNRGIKRTQEVNTDIGNNLIIFINRTC